MGYPEANSQGRTVNLALGTGWSWAQPKWVKIDKKSSSCVKLGMRTTRKEDKAWRKLSCLVQNPNSIGMDKCCKRPCYIHVRPPQGEEPVLSQRWHINRHPKKVC